jgi:AcrR family transcriptional regulator
MRKRAEAVHATRESILDATRQLLIERIDPDAVSLEDVAERASLTEMTVIRHFGSKAALMDATEKREQARISAAKRPVQPHDVAEAIRVLYDHYEADGDWILRMQALELSHPKVRAVLMRARGAHRRWAADTFAARLKRTGANQREDTLMGLVIACDLLTWKLLRRDLRLPRRQAERIVHAMVDALLERS